MNIRESVLKYEEKAVFELRSLYRRYGYLPYKMSKFEEYDLYVRNKDFLVSDHIITFTDTDGKLLALKPDVTLSIIKNGKDTVGCVQKVCYNENVYRVTKGSQSFRELMQVGLECIGDLDDYAIYEVIMLACRSLATISADYVLDISHMGILSAVIKSIGVSQDDEKFVLKCIGEKNMHELCRYLEQKGVNPEKLKKLVSVYGSPDKVIPSIKALDIASIESELASFEKIVDLLKKNGCADNICIDFSVVNDMNYYNGFVFKGFIKGIATGVLSGGQYDKLMKKIGRSSSALGFAVYLDMLERLENTDTGYDVDAIVLYDENSDYSALSDTVNLLSENGKTVMVQKNIPGDVRYKQLLKLNERGVEILENNA